MNPQCEPPEVTRRRWQHRRRMAYAALAYVMALTLIVVGLAVVGKAGELKEFNSILIAVIGGLLSLVGAYFGFSTWYDRR